MDIYVESKSFDADRGFSGLVNMVCIIDDG
jgi:hypothetical protein